LNKYKGKICPYCKTSFLEDDEVVVCDICEMPHHKDCWFDNGQCTTFGCTGKIKDLLPYNQSSTAAVTPPQSQAQSQPQVQATFVPPAQSQAQAAFVPPAQHQQTYSAPAAQPQQQQSFAFCIYCGNKYVVGDMFCRKCGKKIQNAAPISKEEQDKRDYEQAVKLLESQRFDDALQIFTKLADYSDSKEKAKLCVQGKENARKERLYLSAIAVLSKQRVSDTEIKSAIETLTSIADYKDAKARISDLEKMLEKWYEAKKAAEEAARKRQYETAVSYVGSGLFDEAIKIFTDLGEYADCKAQIEKTLEAKETARKEQLYTKSLAVLSAESLTESELKEAIEALNSIENYKDSKEKIPEVEARLEKWYEDKAAAEEAERIRKAKAKAKAKKITILSSIAAVFIAIIVVGIVFVTKSYEIVYDLDGGTIEVANEGSYTLLTDDITLGKPTKEGYTFIGWTGTDLDTPTLDVTITKWSLGNRDYTANWQANSYTITFDTVGGVGSESQSVTFDANAELPTPTKEGYTFEGWYVGDKLYSNGEWKDATDLTLTAKWTANDYTITLDGITEVHPGLVVTFNPNYSGASSTKTTLTNEQKLNYPTNPTRSGYVFTGWYTDAACTNKYNFKGNITTDMTLYAGWKSLTITNNSTYSWKSSGGVLTSTNKGNSSTSEYRITATTPVTITFEYKTSSESGYDYLYIKKNGSQLKSCSGSTSYVSYSVTLATGDYLSFIYSKDSSGSNGSDCAYISNLTFTSTATQTSTAKASCTTNITYEYKTGDKISQTVTFDKDFTLPVPTRRGYAFLGWYNGETKVEAGSWTTASNITLTPKWEVGGNTLTLDANGGTVSSNSVPVIFDKSFTLPTPTRTGYTFDGWFSGDKQYVSGTWNEIDDVTLVAKWTANNYDITYDDTAEVKANVVVTFNPNYSGSTSTTVTLTNGQTLTYPTVPTRSGYAFVGWYTDSSCTTKYNFSGTITENITLYAKWYSMASSYNTREYVDIANYNSTSSKKTFSASASYSSSPDYYYFTCYASGSYTIYAARTSGDFYITVYNATQGSTIMSRYNLYGSSSSKSASFTANAGDVIYVSLYKYSSYDSAGAGTFYVSGAGYPTSTATVNCNTVEGYVYDSNSSISQTIDFGESITLPTPIRTGYSFLGWYNGETKIESGEWDIASDVTLTAKWEAGKNTITLNANGGTVSNTTVSVTYGSAYTLPTPTKTGYTFDGWFNGSTKYTSGTWNEQTDITLVAQWTVKTYNLTLSNTERKDIVVTFDNNYSGSSPSTVTLEDGETLSYPSEPTRNGYAFIGWFTDSSCTTRYNFTGTVTDNMTLYAGWKQISFTNQYTKVEVDPTEYTSSSDYLGLSTDGTNSSYKRYVYFVAEEAGTHYIYYANSSSSSSYKYYLNIYNLTTGSTIKSNATVSSTSFTSASFTCSAGDVIVMAVYKYSSSSYYYSTAYFYFSGFGAVTSNAVAEAEEYVYSSSSNYSEQVTYNTSFTLPTPTRTDYRFLGWYNGNNKVEAGTWNYDTNLTLTPKWEEIVYYNVTFNNATQAIDKINVTLNYNYSGSSNTVVELSNGDTLTYPTVPTRSGYAFAGWYTNSSCTTPYDFIGTITEDITLYAGWTSMQSSTYGSEYLNIANYTSSSQQKSITASSYSSYNYYYFTCYKDGTYTIYGTWTEGDFKFNVSNVTKGTTIISDYNLYNSQTSTSQSFTASAGDVICVRTTRYSSSYNYTSNGKFYVSGASYPTSTAIAQCSETSGAEYSYGSSFTVQVGYGEEFTLPTITRAGYTFLGWYNGNTKVESGTWNIASNVTLTPKWQ